MFRRSVTTQDMYVRRHRIRGWRLWVLRLLTVVVSPILVLVIVEAGLRLVGYGYPTGFVLRSADESGYVTNPRFAWQFFPVAVATSPAMEFIVAPKPSNVYRIVVVGGSAAAGTPHMAFSFGRMLRVMLETRYSNVDFDVINAAVPSMSSHGVLKVVKDTEKFQADLYLVYMGNNEVVGCYGAGTAFAEYSPRLWMIRAAIGLRARRVGQLIAQLMPGRGWGVSDEVLRGLEDRMSLFEGHQIPAGDARLATTARHLAANLHDILAAVQDMQAKAVVSTIAVNLKDWPPFGSQHRVGLVDAEMEEWRACYARSLQAMSAGQWQEALLELDKAAAIDGEYAELHFYLGRCLLARGNTTEAGLHFQRALALDAQRFRAVPDINEVIRHAAASWPTDQVALVDAEVVFAESASVPGLPGNEVLYDHVHFTPSGNYRLARIFLDGIEPLLPQWVRDRAPTVAEIPAQDAVLQELGFTPWERMQLSHAMVSMADAIRNPAMPTLSDEPPATLETKRLFPEEIADTATSYRGLIQRHPDDVYHRWKYAEFMQSIGDWDAADAQLAFLIDRFPQWWNLQVKRATGWRARGQVRKAQRCYEIAAYLNPFDEQILLSLADSCGQVGEVEKAIQWAQKAIRLSPHSPSPYMTLGDIYRAHGDWDSAQEAYEKGVRVAPTHPVILQYVSRFYLTTDDPDVRRPQRAVELARAACESTAGATPDCLALLATACAEVNQIDEAIVATKQAIVAAREAGRADLLPRLNRDLTALELGAYDATSPGLREVDNVMGRTSK